MRRIRRVEFNMERVFVTVIDWETGKFVVRREYKNVSLDSYGRLHKLWLDNVGHRTFVPGYSVGSNNVFEFSLTERH